MLKMTLRWKDVDVDNDIEMRCCYVQNVIVMVYVVYVHGGAVTMMDISSGGNTVVKES